MSARISLLLALALLAAIQGATFATGTPPDPTTPLAALAIKSGTTTLVEWTPGAQAPDYYAVYGVANATTPRSLLATVSGTDDPQAQVPGDFQSYTVSAFTAGVESPGMIATTLDLPCFTFYEGPPPFLAIGCVDGSGVGGHAQLFLSLPP